MGKLDGKVVFVTGAARGQGRAHAVHLAEEGADIIAIDICEQIDTVTYPLATETDLDETVRLVEKLGRRIVAHKADVRDPGALNAALADGVAQLGRLDIVLPNAGITGFTGLRGMSSNHWTDMVDVNLTGVWNTCNAAIPHLRNTGEGGSIVITSSMAGFHAFRGMPHYVTTKHGLVGLVKALALDLGRYNIRVNGVHPTQVDTIMVHNDAVYRSFRPDLENPTREDIAAVSQAMHVLPVPWVESVDISNAILFLVSDEARYITGALLPVDAGADLIA
ncbi:mycofactocin-coupled SDR family oxidoreductase [Nocardia sp. NPDC055029]